MLNFKWMLLAVLLCTSASAVAAEKDSGQSVSPAGEAAPGVDTPVVLASNAYTTSVVRAISPTTSQHAAERAVPFGDEPETMLLILLSSALLGLVGVSRRRDPS